MVDQYKDAIREYREATTSGAEFPDNVQWNILQEFEFLKNCVENRPVISTLGGISTPSTSRPPNSEAGNSGGTNFCNLEEEIRENQGPSMWASARPVQQKNAVLANQLREVVPQYDAFALEKARLGQESLTLIKESTSQLNKLVEKIVAREEEKYDGEKKVYFEILQELYKNISPDKRAKFYLALKECLQNFQ